MKFSDIPEDGIVTYKVGKKEKKDYWYNVYKFTESQEAEWEKWALEELRKEFKTEYVVNKMFLDLILLYGFTIRYTKEKELF